MVRTAGIDRRLRPRDAPQRRTSAMSRTPATPGAPAARDGYDAPAFGAVKHDTVEHERLASAGRPDGPLSESGPWALWGPYLAERAWGTVREDYSADGSAWAFFP